MKSAGFNTIVCGFVGIIFSVGSCQSQDEVPNSLVTNRSLHKVLLLDDKQLEFTTSLSIQFAEETAKVVGRGNFSQLRAEYSAKFFDRLNAEQKSIVRLHSNWAKMGAKHPAAAFSSSYSISKLGLSAKQTTRLAEIKGKLKNSIEQVKKANLEESSSLKPTMIGRLESELLPFQIESLKTHLGDEFDFGDQLGKAVAQAKRVFGDLNSPALSKITASGYKFTPLLTMILASSLHNAPSPVAIVEIVSGEEVGRELHLSSAQRSRLGRLRNSIKAQIEQIDRVVIEINSGDKPSLTLLDKSKNPIQLKQLASDCSEALDDILDDKQKLKVKQLYRRLLVEIYAPDGVALLHPDWSEYLAFTQEQKAAFNEIKDEFKQRKTQLQIDFRADIENLAIEAYEECLEVLTDEQQTQWEKLVGVFGKPRR